ncbi:helix-turn-helix domain-containing protein [Roseococcus pinisoli]|uniref:Helix-turn-helix domain-containing protein n=1 Tax=Roseococcus pinisoli TaxID=2835040 RepID=A0ABS5QIN2_9PROT|nr:helix-turn-helix domain-containing protein [Roseococcus pinisoli]
MTNTSNAATFGKSIRQGDVLSTAQAADVIGVSSRTILRYVRQGVLPSEKRGIRGILAIRRVDAEALRVRLAGGGPL